MALNVLDMGKLTRDTLETRRVHFVLSTKALTIPCDVAAIQSDDNFLTGSLPDSLTLLNDLVVLDFGEFPWVHPSRVPVFFLF